LRQVLTNLVGNAIKFTDAGEVAIAVEPDPASENPGHLRFAVSDTGIGIGEDKLANIFSAFTQADSSTTRKYGGSGLGLTIVERLVGLMGGRVWAESAPGRGSTFFFTAYFEMENPRADGAPISSMPNLNGMKVLVTDDNQTSRAMLAEALTQCGASVVQSPSATDSLDLIRTAGEGVNPFGLMFIDQRMPQMDGLEMLRALIRDAWRLPPVVLMVNSTALSADRPRMQELGLRYYIFKPIRRNDLYATISEIVDTRESRPLGKGRLVPLISNPPSAPESRALRILLADDSPDNRLVVKAFLQKTSFQIDEAENGQRVVEIVQNHRYDLILMDIQMPLLDGFAATRAIREWERAQGLPPVPIIALTASALDEDVQRAREAGCNLHVSKPIKKKTLLSAIAKLTSDSAEAARPFSMIAL
jgi:two-component system sensor histidine kinase/response regulator